MIYNRDGIYNFFRACEKIIEQNSSADLFVKIQHLLESLDQKEFAIYMRQLKKISKEDSHFILDAFSHSQIESKLWIIDKIVELKLTNAKDYLILGGWIGLQARIMSWINILKYNSIISFDISQRASDLAYHLNKPESFSPDLKLQMKTEDIMLINYSSLDSSDVIINSITEHLPDLSLWWKNIKNNQLCILQGSDNPDFEGHVSCCSNMDNFSQLFEMSKTLFEGELKFDNQTRFMKIGYK
jgi:hypothetical protein